MKPLPGDTGKEEVLIPPRGKPQRESSLGAEGPVGYPGQTREGSQVGEDPKRYCAKDLRKDGEEGMKNPRVENRERGPAEET